MPIWAIFLTVWAVGVPVAYVVANKADIAWMRRCEWTEDAIADSIDAWRDRMIAISLTSWFLVIATIKIEIDGRRRRARLAKIESELAELRAHIEGMDWGE